MISDELFDQMRECWAAQIPEAFRWRSDEHSASNPAAAAVIGCIPPDPGPRLVKFFDRISRDMHLTAAQRAATHARENCRRRRKPETPATECV